MTTDVAARGIRVDGIGLIIHADPPVNPLTANVPDSALLRSITGPPAARVAPDDQPEPVPAPAAISAGQATGRGAVAVSAGYRGRRKR